MVILTDSTRVSLLEGDTSSSARDIGQKLGTLHLVIDSDSSRGKISPVSIMIVQRLIPCRVILSYKCLMFDRLILSYDSPTFDHLILSY
ncbi:hypothetical protein RRG08_062279 [Elysia crispata]|uniref:Uncharacterized protein n=1 Tax=Elysia crispata TaxID=231223 RepID=A0AAE0YGK0_9GAST|nr:hypothetical protein RRG08_062279 [Elysia crispata]